MSVITHELGHNLGSEHTHSCVWNGNNTQIDDCGNKYIDEQTTGTPNSCYDSNNQILPPSGTVMSYCHLYNNVDLNLGFGTQPGNLIRSRVNAANCLSACSPTCNDVALVLTINLDNYPLETTWTIADDSGITVASGGPYPSQAANLTVVENLCITQGCYNFIINDMYGDGICCGYGSGSYSLTDEDENILASGGQFDSSETTPFCLSGGSGWQTCDPTIDLGTQTLATGTVHAQNKVISANNVPAQTNVSLKAGETIQLNIGFNIDADADVEILIEDCLLRVPD